MALAFIIGTIWGIIGLVAWIFLMVVTNRKYKTPVSRSLFLLMLACVVMGPIAWFPVLVIKAIHETE